MNKFIPPTLQQMRLFEAVARLGSITRAAEEVNLTQPTVSMQIKTMEEKIGLPLTEQIGRKLFLTHAGQEVAAASRDILDRLGDLQGSLEDIHGEVAGSLSVAVISSAKYFLPQLLGSFKRRFPRVEPKLQITNRETILERLSRSADDLYIIGRPPDGDALISEPFMENVIVFTARSDHPLARERHIPLSRIAQENVIRREPGSGTRKAVEKIFQNASVPLDSHMEFDDAEAIKQGVMSGLGIASLSLHSLRLELGSGDLTVLDVEGFPLRRQWFMVYRAGRRLSKAAEAFHDFLLEESQREMTKG